MKKTVVEQEIAPRRESGCDYNAAGKVLVRAPGKRLVWRPGRRYCSGVMNPNAYAEASLDVLGDPCNNSLRGIGKRVFQGGRLSRTRLAEHIDVIRAALGVPGLQACEIDLHKTLVVTP